MTWRKDIAPWRIGPTLYLSVPFTWLLPEARQMAEAHKGPVVAGGPAVDLMPAYLRDVAKTGVRDAGFSPVPPLLFHNPLATFTTRGCPNSCPFCAVPRIEGEFRELSEWDPRPVLCDNNLLAATWGHLKRVVDRLKVLPAVDFNQGLDARLFKQKHAWLFADLQRPKIRFAFDHPNMEGPVKDAVDLARTHGLKDIGIYVLICYDETPEEAVHRLETVRSWGIWPNPMRFQPLDALAKNTHLGPGWTEFRVLRVMKYYSRLRWFKHIPFEEFRYQGMLEAQPELWTAP